MNVRPQFAPFNARHPRALLDHNSIGLGLDRGNLDQSKHALSVCEQLISEML